MQKVLFFFISDCFTCAECTFFNQWIELTCAKSTSFHQYDFIYAEQTYLSVIKLNCAKRTLFINDWLPMQKVLFSVTEMTCGVSMFFNQWLIFIWAESIFLIWFLLVQKVHVCRLIDFTCVESTFLSVIDFTYTESMFDWFLSQQKVYWEK